MSAKLLWRFAIAFLATLSVACSSSHSNVLECQYEASSLTANWPSQHGIAFRDSDRGLRVTELVTLCMRARGFKWVLGRSNSEGSFDLYSQTVEPDNWEREYFR
jgi:hypothetical protein